MTDLQATPGAAAADADAGVQPAGSNQARRVAIACLALVALVIAIFPLVITDPTATSIAVFTLVFMVAAVSWNIFCGYSGYLALGHAVFFGTGGYTVALVAQHWHVAGGWPVFALLPIAGLVAGLVAIPIGLVALRTRRHTFVVVTIAIFFIFQVAATNLGFTGGTSGLYPPIAPFSAANFNVPFYYVALAILIPTILVSWAIRRSRFGLQLLSIRDDEDRALGLGVRTRRVKLIAFIISAIPIGMVGGLYVDFLGEVYPQVAFDPLFDLSIALMAFFGGLGTLVGPLLGALVLESLQQYLTLTFSSDATYLIAYGILFLAVILLMPRGVVPAITTRLERRRVGVKADSADDPERQFGGVAGATP